MGHIQWLFAFVICFTGRSAFCDLALTMKNTVTGVRRYSVEIPCTYTPNKDYEEHSVEWSLITKGTEVIIQRIESEDHIPLTRFRGRVQLSKSPGIVSLTISKLDTDDRGHVNCKVTWKKKDGSLISKEEMSILKVARANSETSTDDITTEDPNLETIQPTTEKPKENIIATTLEEPNSETFVDFITTEEPNLETMMPKTEKPEENIITTTLQEDETTMPKTEKPDEKIITTTLQEDETTIPPTENRASTVLPEMTTDFGDVSHFSPVSTMESTTTIMDFHETTPLIPTQTVEMFDNKAPTAQKKGFGISLYMLIFIALCVLCITIVVIVLIINKKKKKGSFYEPYTMSQLSALEGCGNGVQSSADEARATNTYEPCNPPVSVYEGIVLPFSSEYDSLILEKEAENNCS
ncbi:V-set and immunoglobulin domain-containing protein 4 isoform 2-T2 [Leptodactylus fuscus]|uniref:V-set and immunoglobulin domain-containing protein 4 isoform X2 n=1 Tax=Leptodactylus fuscus TaxID=238119 RepID=UPI003F4ECDF0